MNRSHFRALLVISFLAALASGLVDSLIPGLLAEDLDAQLDAEIATYSELQLVLVPIVALPLLLVAIIATIGLYCFSAWAPKLNLIVTIIGIVVLPLLGSNIQSGIAAALATASSYAWGACILISFLPIYSRWADPGNRELKLSAA